LRELVHAETEDVARVQKSHTSGTPA
jgi:hypothetical protein